MEVMEKNTYIKALEDLTTSYLKIQQRYLDHTMQDNEDYLIKLEGNGQFYRSCQNVFINCCGKEFCEYVGYELGHKNFEMYEKEIVNWFEKYVTGRTAVMFINTFHHWYRELSDKKYKELLEKEDEK